MAGTSNAAAANKAAGKAPAEKVQEKVVEKRRALGRGLDSLIPGPRAVAAPTSPAVTTLAREGVNPALDSAGRAAVLPVAPLAVDLMAAAESESSRVEPFGGSSSAEGLPAGMGSSAPAEGISPALEAGGGTGTATGPSPLAPSPITPSPVGDEVLRLTIDLIDPNPHQTRSKFGELALKELAESIRMQGVVQPIVVRAGAEGRYTLILGERRLRATRIAGLETIPAMVKRVSEQQAAEMTLVENLQRQDLNCLEQAEAFSNLSKHFHLTQEQIGARVGVSRETVSNYMRLLGLPEGVQIELLRGTLTYSHARALLQLNTSSHAVIWAYAKKAMEEKMSVAKLEELVIGVSGPRAPKAGGGARWVDPNVKAAQRSLEEVLGMRVRIRDRNGRGKILIEYSTVDDFQRVVEMLGGK